MREVAGFHTACIKNTLRFSRSVLRAVASTTLPGRSHEIDLQTARIGTPSLAEACMIAKRVPNARNAILFYDTSGCYGGEVHVLSHSTTAHLTRALHWKQVPADHDHEVFAMRCLLAEGGREWIELA